LRTCWKCGADRILREVEKDEAEHEHYKLYGKTNQRKNPARHVEAEHFVETEDVAYNRPRWDLVRH
jgi:hypothetical protein